MRVNNLKALAGKIEHIINMTPAEKEKISADMREIVVQDHSLKNFIGNFINELYE